MSAPNPTPIYRLIHIDNLAGICQRQGIYAPNSVPDDEIPYRCIHHESIQERRSTTGVSCGPRGVLHDYVPFYFGIMPPMLLALRDGYVEGYHEGQEPLIYLVTSAQEIQQAGLRFVFTDGQGIMSYTQFFDDLEHLRNVPWNIVNERYWFDTDEQPDRKRRKQAEFLVHRFCPWTLIKKIGVRTDLMRDRVQKILAEHTLIRPPLVAVQSQWYY